LKELVTTLREIGIEIEWSTDPTTKTRTIRIRKVPPMSYMSSLNDSQAQDSELVDDIGGGSGDTLHNTKPPPRPPAFTGQQFQGGVKEK
jgi:hypothetical protein